MTTTTLTLNDHWLARRNEALQLRLAASAERDRLLAWVAVQQLTATQGTGRDIEASYYHVGR